MKKSKWPLKRAKLTLNGESVKWENKWNKVLKISIFLSRYSRLPASIPLSSFRINIKKIIKGEKGIHPAFLCVYTASGFFLLFRLDFLQFHFSSSKRETRKTQNDFSVYSASSFHWWVMVLYSSLHYLPLPSLSKPSEKKK